MNSKKPTKERVIEDFKRLSKQYGDLLQRLEDAENNIGRENKKKPSCALRIRNFFRKKARGLCLLICIVISSFALLTRCTSSKKQTEEEQKYRKELSKKLYKTRDEDSLKIYLKQFLEEKNDLALMLCYKELGRYCRENARFTDAITNHQEGLNIALALKDTAEIVQAFNNLGTDFRRIGALSEASEYHYKALEYAEIFSGAQTSGGIKNRVVAMNGIGNISLTLGYLDDAEKYFRNALKEETVLKSHVGQAINLANIGAIFEKRQQYDSAFAYYNKSLEQNQIAKSDMGIGLCLIHLGNLYKIANQYPEAKNEYLKAYTLMEKISDRWHWLEACISIAEISLITNNMPAFDHYISLAETTAAEIKSPEHLATIYELKHRCQIARGDYPKALESYKHAKAMQDSVQGIQKSNRYMELRVSYERDKNAYAIQQIEQKNKVEKDQKQRTIYISWAALLMGIVISALLYYGYRQRTQSNRVLKKVERARTDFFTNITHELRTPLTVIKGLNERMRTRNNLSEKEKTAFMAAIDRQSNNLLNLVEQLLDIARLKSGADTPEWRHGDIVPYLRMIAETFRLYAEEQNIHLVFYTEMNAQEMDFIPFYMDKIVANLLSNAIKHSDESDNINFIVAKAPRADQIIIRVADTGEGIAPEDMERIFEMFYQSPNAINHTGTGIGLAFTRMLVEKMNGKIEVESQLGKGSVFTVTLPLKTNATPAILPLQLQQQDKTRQKSATHTENTERTRGTNDNQIENRAPQSARPSLLIVEDHKDILLYLKSLLGDTYDVFTAKNGQQALQIAEKIIPDLVITDVMMPVMDGYELCREMKENALLNHIPLIMLTAKSDDQDRLEGLRCGVEAYIRKPFHVEELRLRIHKILENRVLLKEKYMRAIVSNGNPHKPHTDENMKFLQNLTNLIYAEISNPRLNGAFLADKMAMSVSQLNRKINGTTGCSTIAYLLKVKLSKARKTLKSENTSIADVAYACGFSDPSYFARAFKKEFGYSPSEYQRIPDIK